MAKHNDDGLPERPDQPPPASDETLPKGRAPKPKGGDRSAAPNPKPPGKRRQRQAERAAQIYTTPPTAEDIAFMARELILCTLPHSDPGDVLSWSRTNGNFTLAITSGIDTKTGKPFGIPYGTIPRLILVWMVTQIIRTKSPRLELGTRLSDFLLRLGLDPSRGGKCSDATRTRIQIERLLHATLVFRQDTWRKGLQGDIEWGEREKDVKVSVERWFWWNRGTPAQAPYWGSYIVVSQEFYDAVVKSPNPLDIRVLRHIKDSALGIDLYTILNREAYRAMQDDKPRFLAWEWLLEQTGNEYGDIRDFRRKALEQIEAILAVHPGLIITQQRACKGRKSGLVISNLSTPSILPATPMRKLPPVIEGQAKPAPPLAVVPPRIQHLRPAAVATFRARYPGVDPYECQQAFDAWQASLPPEKRARQYNCAFLGFARSWVEEHYEDDV